MLLGPDLGQDGSWEPFQMSILFLLDYLSTLVYITISIFMSTLPSFGGRDSRIQKNLFIVIFKIMKLIYKLV